MMSTPCEAPTSCRGYRPTLVERTHLERQNSQVVRDRTMRFVGGRQCRGKGTEGYLRVVQMSTGEASHMAILQLTSIPSVHDIFLSSMKSPIDAPVNMDLGAC